jgi:hypothetical protein
MFALSYLFVGDDAYIVPCGNYQICIDLVMRTVYRFAVWVDVGIDPYEERR